MTEKHPEIDRQAAEREFDAMMAAAPMPPVPDLRQMQEEENSAVAAAKGRHPDGKQYRSAQPPGRN